MDKNKLDFLIVGAAKSGTTSLYQYLNQHPYIFMPTNKEPWFFCSDAVDDSLNIRLDIIRKEEDYWNLFCPATDEQLKGEASTGYLFFYKHTIQNIKRYVPEWKYLKIIMIIRNPIDRAFSHYLNDRVGGTINKSFYRVVDECLLGKVNPEDNYIDYGFYYSQIQAYLENFKHVKIILFDDFKNDSESVVSEIFDFLDVDSSFRPSIDLQYNVSAKKNVVSNMIYKKNFIKSFTQLCLPKIAREKIKNFLLKTFSEKPVLNEKTKSRLREIYRQDISELQRLIDKDLSRWLL